MKAKIILAVAAVVAVIGCIIAAALFTSTPAVDKSVPENAVTSAVHPPETNHPAAPQKIAASANIPQPPEKSDGQGKETKPLHVTQAEQPIKINDYELEDPLARVALNFVGTDPEAAAYWLGAINDSSMPAEERKDLIEDLNEDGLSNPRHPAVQDLPLIMARIRLVEQLAPRAMDNVNRDAFAEAYKDLVGLLNGQPPK